MPAFSNGSFEYFSQPEYQQPAKDKNQAGTHNTKFYYRAPGCQAG
jgi:hypothetical protein